jgi:ABC-type nitrate/sulfonate/bicarbonate transport system permease component
MTGVADTERRTSTGGTAPGGSAPGAVRVRRMSPRWITAGVTVAAVVVAIAAWGLLSAVLVHSILLPTPSATGSALWDLITTQSSRSDIWATLWRIIKGFAAGSVVGILIGVLMGLSNVGQFLIEPHVSFFRFVTPIALITPAAAWFGVDETATFVLVVYATTWPVAINTCAGLRSVVPNRVRMARSFSEDALWSVSRHIVLPSLVPQMVVGMRLGLSYSFMTVVGLEMLAGSDGLGNLIYTSRVFYRSDVMFAGIFLLGIFGFVSDRLFVLIIDRSLGRYSYGNHR